MTKYIVSFLAVLILYPSMAFAATDLTPKEQYIAFLKQELAVLEAELAQILAEQAASTTVVDVVTPATTIPETTGSVSVPIPSPWVQPSECATSHRWDLLSRQGIDCLPTVSDS